ncbi:MAG: carbohydrate ABC transporter permease [Acutalibacter sp.]|uniref:carbohydrate ABC transporter permease n=1 Tax=unclassified Acutalibacter TaxID=2620728 RepID=UPI00216D1636|nr:MULTISPECIES: carbohydrate ABC transporter permease [unclassified Acutalibacter]MCI9225756.1 carbohydrate ABC transporter permease [Acutalibacter sp.]
MISSRGRKIFVAIAGAAVTLVALLCIFPFWMVVIGSLTPENEIYVRGYSLWPQTFSTEAYKLAFEDPGKILRSYLVTVGITGAGTAVSLFIVSMCGYVLQRPDFKSRNFFTMFVFFTVLFNGGLVPWYILMTNYLHLKDNYLALILPMMVNVFYLIIMKNFMRSIPGALIESAKIDGAGEFYIFLRIVLPLAKPALASIGMFIALNYWNDWRNGMLFMQDETMYPLQYYLYRLLSSLDFLKSAAASTIDLGDQVFPSESFKLAMTVVATGPIILLYPFVQKYFVKGITIGAVKG